MTRQGGRSCAGARVAPAEKFGLGRKLHAPWLLLPLFHLSQISIKSESNFQIFHSDKIVFLGNRGKFLRVPKGINFRKKFQTAFDRTPSFLKIMLQFFKLDTKPSKIDGTTYGFIYVGMRAR